MNQNIKQVSYLVIGFLILLLINSTYWQFGKSKEINQDPRNSRNLIREFSRLRGQILTTDGDIIAYSTPTDNNYKYLRKYPKGRQYSHLSGYYSLRYETSGLEQIEESILSGTDDILFGRRFLDTISGRNPKGGNVITTINSKLQESAYKLLATGCAGKPCKGSIVALKPTTGEILAMASTPTFDPNQIANHNESSSEKYWNKVNELKPSPLINQATSELFPPGSTFKIITTIAALEQGISTSQLLTSAPVITLPNTTTTLTNYGSTSCPSAIGGKVTLKQAFAYSCNTAFVDLTTKKMKNGILSLEKTAEKFGFNKDQGGIPLKVATSSTGNIEDLASLGQSSIGQRDIRLTPLMNAEIVATIANGGTHMKPYLIKKFETSGLDTVKQFTPINLGRVIAPEINSIIVDFMRESEKFSGKNNTGLTLASKTGTAEHGDDKFPHSWYVAFTPIEELDFAVSIIIEDGGAQGMGATGASVAAPLARELFSVANRLESEQNVTS